MKITLAGTAPASVITGAESTEVTGEITLHRLLEGGDMAMLISDYTESSAAHMHGHEFEHDLYLLDGELSIDTPGPDGRAVKTPLKKGDSAFIPAGAVHGFSTGPGQTARVLVVVPAAAMAGGHSHD